MTHRHALFALAAAGALGLAACETDNVSPASSGPATASAPNGAPQGSDSSGKPVNPRPAPETPPVAPGGP
jgi:hypothetical protein